MDEQSRELLDKLPVDDKQEDIIESLQLKTAIDGLPDKDTVVQTLRKA